MNGWAKTEMSVLEAHDVLRERGVDWPDWRTQTWSQKELMWIEGYDSLQHRINEMITHLAIADGYRMTMSAFTAEQMERVNRQRELDRLRNEAYVNIKQLAEPHGYLT